MLRFRNFRAAAVALPSFVVESAHGPPLRPWATGSAGGARSSRSLSPTSGGPISGSPTSGRSGYTVGDETRLRPPDYLFERLAGHTEHARLG